METLGLINQIICYVVSVLTLVFLLANILLSLKKIVDIHRNSEKLKTNELDIYDYELIKTIIVILILGYMIL